MEYILLGSITVVGFWLLYYRKEWLYLLAVGLIPLSVGISLPGGANISYPAEILLAMAALSVAQQLILKWESYRRIFLHPITLLLLAELGWMIVSAIFSELPLVSFKRVLMRTIFIASLFLFTAHWFGKEGPKIKYLFLYAIGLLPAIFLTEYHHLWNGLDPKMNVELSRPFYNEHTIYGAAVAFVVPLLAVAAFHSKKIGLTKVQGTSMGVLLVIFLIAEYYSYSRAGLLSLMVSALFFALLKFKLQFKHLLMGVTVVLVVLISFKDRIYEFSKSNTYESNGSGMDEHLLSSGNLSTNVSNLERLNRWKCALRMFRERPVVGFGPGTFQFVYGPYQRPDEMTRISTTTGDKGNAHSEVFTSLSETGLPGVILNLLWMMTTIGVAMRTYYNSKDAKTKSVVLAAMLGFLTFVFHGLFNSFLDQDKIAGLVFSSMAILVAADISSAQQKNSNEKNR